MDWIDYEDRMPDRDGEYLTVCRGRIRILNFARDLRAVDKYDFADKDYPGWYAYDDEYGNYEVVGVSHWAPQPEVPKELGGLG